MFLGDVTSLLGLCFIYLVFVFKTGFKGFLDLLVLL